MKSAQSVIPVIPLMAPFTRWAAYLGLFGDNEHHNSDCVHLFTESAINGAVMRRVIGLSEFLCTSYLFYECENLVCYSVTPSTTEPI